MGWRHDIVPPRSPMRREPASDEARAAQTLYPKNERRGVDSTRRSDDEERSLDVTPSLAQVPPKAQREIKRNACAGLMDSARKRLVDSMRLADELGDATLHMHLGLCVTALDDGRSHLAEGDDD